MEFLTNHQSYDICFSVASLVLILVTVLIHMSEENFYNRQRHIFGALIVTAFLQILMGLAHNLYLYYEIANVIIGYEANTIIVLAEKIFTYLLPYFSILYVMSIFQIEPDSIAKKAVLLIPTMYAVFFFIIGYVTRYFFDFNERGVLEYIYPQGASVNICVYLYFVFATYLLIKYTKTLSSEKASAIGIYYVLLLMGIPIRLFTKSSSVFEFSVSLALLLCVYTFQNPSEFIDRMSGAGTQNALRFSIATNLLQRKEFTLLGVHIERLSSILGGESAETASDLLNQISDYLKQLCPQGQIFYPDIEDFIMLFPGIAPDEIVIEKTTEQIRKRFKDTWKIGEKETRLFESPFALLFPDEVDSIERYSEVRGVMEKALAKQSREILRMSDLNMKVVEHDKKIDNIVKRAIEDELLEVYFQPIYTPATGKFSSCEALLRLKDPQLGYISPAILMPIAERNGTVLAIDKFVLSRVCELFSTTTARKYGLEYAEVNLSIVDCIQTNLVDNVIGTLEKYKVMPEEINFEVTETYEQGITTVMNENIKKLMERGFSFSMDDFGTGYSNIARVASMPVTIFKLDKSIVQSAFDSEVSYMVMINLIKIIKALKKEIVVEGIETGEQARQMIKLGCDHIQGFFYARPMPMNEFVQFLRDHNG